MSEDILGECYFFLHAALTGIVLSNVYDILRIWRRVHSHGCMLVAVEDFFYWIGSALYIFYVLMKENNGIIRWFFIVGIVLGMAVYNLTIGPYIVKYMSKILKKILDVVNKILKFVAKPFAFLWKHTKKAGRFCGKIGKKLKKGLKKCYKTIKIGISKK